MNRSVLVVAALALALSGCEGYSEMQGKPSVPGIFGDTPAAPPLRIDNPDQPIVEVWIDYVWGKTDRIAEQECRRLANRYGLAYSRYRRTSQDRRKNAPYECWGFENHPDAVYEPKAKRR